MSLEYNHRIYVQDGQTWSAKGRFVNALKDDEGISWQEQDGGLILPLAFVSNYYLVNLLLLILLLCLRIVTWMVFKCPLLGLVRFKLTLLPQYWSLDLLSPQLPPLHQLPVLMHLGLASTIWQLLSTSHLT